MPPKRRLAVAALATAVFPALAFADCAVTDASGAPVASGSGEPWQYACAIPYVALRPAPAATATWASRQAQWVENRLNPPGPAQRAPFPACEARLAPSAFWRNETRECFRFESPLNGMGLASGYADGYWALLKFLEPGKYPLRITQPPHTKWQWQDTYSVDATYTIDVSR